jgi:galactoside O-acetyltransferase
MTRFLSATELAVLGFQSIGFNVLVDRAAVFINPSAISLGDDCRIDAFALISAGSAGVEIGRNVHLGPACQLFGGGGRLILEDFSGLSGRASAYTCSDDFLGGSMTNPTIPDRFRDVRNGPVVLRKHSLVGCGSVILPGVEMGFGSAAGALTVVRKSVPECVVVIGNPARTLSRRRNRSRLEQLERDFLAADRGMANS